MIRPSPGRYLALSSTQGSPRAFIPAPLPPHPPLRWTAERVACVDQAVLALGRLDAAATLAPESAPFHALFMRQEAVCSSRIEGLQATLTAVLLAELGLSPRAPVTDVQEVMRYVAAYQHGLTRLSEGLPLSLRLVREIHGALLGGDGSRYPGEFRRCQNWLGGATPAQAVFIPPPPAEVMPCLGDWERFLHDQPEPTSLLVKAALAHVQFETIHPFADGNGRVGRLLIPLQLWAHQALQAPLLSLSRVVLRQRPRYYALLDQVRQRGDWEAWVDFFAAAVRDSATESLATLTQLLTLARTDRARSAGRPGADARQCLHQALLRQPVATARALVTATGLTPTTVARALAELRHREVITYLPPQRPDGEVVCYPGVLRLLEADGALDVWRGMADR